MPPVVSRGEWSTGRTRPGGVAAFELLGTIRPWVRAGKQGGEAGGCGPWPPRSPRCCALRRGPAVDGRPWRRGQDLAEEPGASTLSAPAPPKPSLLSLSCFAVPALPPSARTNGPVRVGETELPRSPLRQSVGGWKYGLEGWMWRPPPDSLATATAEGRGGALRPCVYAQQHWNCVE